MPCNSQTITTPIADFLDRYADSEIARLHMPGHKGFYPHPSLAQAARYDITEVDGADSLFEADGIIRNSEENTAALYGNRLSCFSAGGSTLCIQAMVALTCKPGDTILAVRNAHHAFLNACALLDVSPRWILPRYNDSFGVSGEASPAIIADALSSCPQAKAVYVTSPDYLGCMSDLAGIAQVCRASGVPLLVDNAHGAHLRFLPEDWHPMSLGASLCSDSGHKTLPVLTGGAVLHVASDYPATREQVKAAMGLFGSTSPSYLILRSLDLCNRYLAEHGQEDFAALSELTESIYTQIAEKGFRPIACRHDPTKITLDAYEVGMTGTALADYLRDGKIECEYASARHVVLMLSPQNLPSEIERLRRRLAEIPTGKPSIMAVSEAEVFSLPEQAMRLREAVFAPKECLPVEQALGRIAAETRIKCPPGVPVVVAGEMIGKDTQKILKRSSIRTINVIK